MSDGLDIDLRREVGETPKPTGNPLVDAWRSVWGVIKSWGPPLLAVFVIRSIIAAAEQNAESHSS